MLKKGSFIILFFLMFILGCYEDNSTFNENRKYIGFWYETKWTFNFNQNGNYILFSEGHGGGNPKSGSYIIKDSLILLISDTEDFENWRLKRLKITREGCLRDYRNNIYCENEEKLNEISEKVFWESLEVQENLDKLEIVQKKREELAKQDSLKKYMLISNGIVVIDKKEYFEHQLVSWHSKYRRNQIHLRLYSKLNPARIYNTEFELIKVLETGTSKAD